MYIMNVHLLRILSVVTSLHAIASARTGDDEWGAQIPDVRSRFVSAIQRIKGDTFEPGSTMAEVKVILGDPDDVITEQDSPLWPDHVVWCYGSAGHLSLPTLGTLTFDDSGRVNSIQGASAVAPAADLLPEPQLRDVLRTIDRVRVDFLEPAEFNPRDMVAVVNSLRQLGKKNALAALREYSRIQSTSGLDGGCAAIIVMRFLFSSPVGGTHPTTYLPFEEYKSASFPAFPAVVIEGVPLYVFPLGAWGMGGGLPHVGEYLDWYEAHGTIIERPLRPVDDPLRVWESWQRGLGKTIQASDANHASAADDLVLTQLLRMIDTVHARQFDDDTVSFANKQDLWADATVTLHETACRWDEDAGLYVRAKDGSYIEPSQEPQYARAIWELPIEGRRSRLVMRRISEDTVDISVEQIAKDAPPIPTMSVRIFAAGGDSTVEIASLEVDGDFTSGSQSTSSRVTLGKGTQLRAQLIRDANVIAESPVMNIDRDVRRGSKVSK